MTNRTETMSIKAPSRYYALSALGNLIGLSPGPMAQAITFRANGAETGVFTQARGGAAEPQCGCILQPRVAAAATLGSLMQMISQPRGGCVISSAS